MNSPTARALHADQPGTKRRPRAEWQIQRDTHPALITEAEAEAILERLEANPHRGKRGASHDYLLTGILVDPDGCAWHGDGAGAYYRAGKGRVETLGRCRILDERRYLAESAMRICGHEAVWLPDGSCPHCNAAMQTSRRPMTAEQWRDKTREFMICAKPFFKAKADIYAFTMPRLLIRADGQIESIYEFTAEQQQALDQLDEAIKYLQQLIYEKQP